MVDTVQDGTRTHTTVPTHTTHVAPYPLPGYPPPHYPVYTPTPGMHATVVRGSPGFIWIALVGGFPKKCCFGIEKQGENHEKVVISVFFTKIRVFTGNDVSPWVYAVSKTGNKRWFYAHPYGLSGGYSGPKRFC